MVEDGNRQGELKDCRKPGCFDPEEFRAGQSSSDHSSAATGRGHGRSTGEPSAAGGERRRNCPRWSGCLFSWMDLGSRCRRPTFRRKTNRVANTYTRAGAGKAAKRPSELWDGWRWRRPRWGGRGGRRAGPGAGERRSSARPRSLPLDVARTLPSAMLMRRQRRGGCERAGGESERSGSGGGDDRDPGERAGQG